LELLRSLGLVLCTLLASVSVQAKFMKLEEDLYDVTIRDYCPDIDDLPTTDKRNENFFAIRLYSMKGDPNPELSCNGRGFDNIAGTQSDPIGDLATPMGSLYVHAGCTFYGYELHHYEGNINQYDGPLFLSEVPNIFGTHCEDTPCFPSYRVECRMRMPDCVPEDSWDTLASFDNSDSANAVFFTYAYTIGTSWAADMAEDFAVSDNVEAAMKERFWFLFRAHLSISETTGYDWSEISSEAQNGEQQLFAEIEILAGSVVEIQQTKGTCGDSTVSTELLRTVVTKKNGEVVSSVNFKQ